MGRVSKVPIRERRALNQLLLYTAQAPKAPHPPFGAQARALRSALHMTQAQLARRTGLPQAHIARIEAGRIDPQLGTLRRVFDALLCDLVVAPRARQRSGDALAERASLKARDKRHEELLLADPSARLWDD